MEANEAKPRVADERDGADGSSEERDGERSHSNVIVSEREAISER